MTRLAFLVDSPSRRAHGNAASRLALGLAEIGGIDVALVCYGDDPAPPWLPPQVGIHRLGTSRASRSLPAIVGYLHAEQPDVLVTRQVHANFVGLAASLLARVPRRWNGKLVLVQDHPVDLSHASNRRDNKWLAKLSYRFADGVISPSPAVRDNVVAWCGLDASSSAIVPNPIPKFTGAQASPPHPWLAGDGPPVFVNTSNMTRWKRLDLLIDAFAELRQRHEARLLILGEGAGRSPADEQIVHLGLSECAETVGWVEDPLQYAARAWAFVLASDEEGFAQVLTEAMSTGCPVISTDARGGGPQFVTDSGQYGLLPPRGNRAELAAAMELMLQPEAREKYRELGLRRVAEFSPASCATALVGFLSAQLGVPWPALDEVVEQSAELVGGERGSGTETWSPGWRAAAAESARVPVISVPAAPVWPAGEGGQGQAALGGGGLPSPGGCAASVTSHEPDR
jgi:glycosyltransferase involved in cell wall biosynthesis